MSAQQIIGQAVKQRGGFWEELQHNNPSFLRNAQRHQYQPQAPQIGSGQNLSIALPFGAQEQPIQKPGQTNVYHENQYSMQKETQQIYIKTNGSRTRVTAAQIKPHFQQFYSGRNLQYYLNSVKLPVSFHNVNSESYFTFTIKSLSYVAFNDKVIALSRNSFETFMYEETGLQREVSFNIKLMPQSFLNATTIQENGETARAIQSFYSTEQFVRAINYHIRLEVSYLQQYFDTIYRIFLDVDSESEEYSAEFLKVIEIIRQYPLSDPLKNILFVDSNQFKTYIQEFSQLYNRTIQEQVAVQNFQTIRSNIMRYDFLRRFEFYFDPATSKISTRLNLMKKGIFAFQSYHGINESDFIRPFSYEVDITCNTEGLSAYIPQFFGLAQSKITSIQTYKLTSTDELKVEALNFLYETMFKYQQQQNGNDFYESVDFGQVTEPLQLSTGYVEVSLPYFSNMYPSLGVQVRTTLNTNSWDQDGEKQNIIGEVYFQGGPGTLPTVYMKNESKSVHTESIQGFHGFHIFFTDLEGNDMIFPYEGVVELIVSLKPDNNPMFMQ